MSASVLCPGLYSRLKAVFRDVGVVDEGLPAQIIDQHDGGYRWTEIGDPGEYYTVSCPYCGDSRKRLWINHRFGEYRWMAVCYNETRCMDGAAGWANREDLHQKIMAGTRWQELPVTQVDHQDDEEPGPVPLPGDVELVDRIPRGTPALEYLLKRNFDPAYLSWHYAVSAVTSVDLDEDGHRPPIMHRVFVPVVFDRQMVAWQARYPDDIDWKATGVRKYWNRKRMPRRKLLYGYDQAAPYRSLAIVEGVTDVWRVGPPAVATLGCSLSRGHIDLICERRPGQTIAVCYDGEAWENSLAAVDRLRTSYAMRGGSVFPVALPTGFDPADIGSDGFWSLVASQAATHRLWFDCELTRRRPA